MKPKSTSFWCDVHSASIIQQMQEITGQTQGWVVRHLIKKAFLAIRSGTDTTDELEDRIVKLHAAYKDQMEKMEKRHNEETTKLVERINSIELSMERSAIR